MAYFDQLLAALEGPAAELREVIEDEGMQLLGVAVDRIFTNLKLLVPDFDLSPSLREQVDAFCNRFRRAEAAPDFREEEARSAEVEDGSAEEAQSDAASP